MASFTVVRMPDQNVNNHATPHGHLPEWRKRLLGLDGATATGLGTWVRAPSAFKTFFLYNNDRVQASVGAASVEIHAAMELADTPDNTAYAVLATLDASTRHFSTENPWSFFRAEVKATNGATPIQVGMEGIE